MLKKGYKPEKCAVCSSQAILTNNQGILVCLKHQKNKIDLKCLCGLTLDTQKSKYGAFFSCSSCGPVSLKKALEMNDNTNNVKRNNTLKFKIQEKPKINNFI